ncbi:hypothetical protein [Actinoplanes sp. NPDC049681]|uniref:hypothetical protein n=1 Tax=Actinoplanes sp. NPDC049681 TaxID=3363905 RepID=UPI00379AD5AF
MRIEFTFSRDGDYFRRQLTPGARQATVPLLAGGGALVVAGVVVAGALHFTAAVTVIGLALTLAGLALLVVRSRRVRTMVTVPGSWHSPRRWLLTDQGLESSTALTSAAHAWSTFRGGKVRDNAYILVQDGPVIVDIPRLPLTREQDEELCAFLTARGLLTGQR